MELSDKQYTLVMRPARGGLKATLSCSQVASWASGSFLAMVEAHAAITWAQRGVCHQLRRQVSGPVRQRQAHPSREGSSSPLFWAWRGCQHRSCQSVLETRQTLTNSARFPLTSLQPYLVARPKAEAPKHLSLPGLRGLRWPLELCWGLVIQMENSSVWPWVHRVCLQCPRSATG